MSMLNRIYADYPKPSRLVEYEALVRDVARAGYAQLSVREFFRDTHGKERPSRKRFVHRHDIDSGVRTARKMFAIGSRYGVHASYYFRLSTLDYGFMRDIEAAGSEASYHDEEIADFAKRHRLRSADAVRRRFPEIRELFVRDVSQIVDRLGLPLTTVASHGDFAKRRLKLINHEPLEALGKYQHICLLTHPVQWETNWIESTRLNLRRVIEEMAWRWA